VTNDRRCATRHCCQATASSAIPCWTVACHALTRFGVAPSRPEYFMWQTTRNSHHRQLPIRSHSASHPTAHSNCTSDLLNIIYSITICLYHSLAYAESPSATEKTLRTVIGTPLIGSLKQCLISPPTILPFRPSRPRTDPDWRTRRTQLSTVRLVITLHHSILQITIADV